MIEKSVIEVNFCFYEVILKPILLINRFLLTQLKIQEMLKTVDSKMMLFAIVILIMLFF